MRGRQLGKRPIALAITLVCVIAPAGWAQLTPYNQDFETLTASDPTALSNDGWLVFGNVFDAITNLRLYGYGPFPAPNNGAAFCAIAAGQGGVDQGAQQLSVYSDYNNLAEHMAGNHVESNVFQEQVIGAGDVGKIYTFRFDAKLGNLAAPSTAQAFIKTLDPSSGFALTRFITANMTNIPVTWATYHVSLQITAGLVGQIFQFGFLSNATNFNPSAIFYDNIRFGEGTVSDAAVSPRLFTLHQNHPNPFNPTTRIAFDLDQSGRVDLSVYDAAGKHVATLRRGWLDSGRHTILWDGRTESGTSAAAGVYRYVLHTPLGTTARSMVLVK